MNYKQILGVFSLERKHKALRSVQRPSHCCAQPGQLPPLWGLRPCPGAPWAAAPVLQVNVRISGCCGTKPACAGCLRLQRSLWEEQNHSEDVLKDYPALAIDLHRCCTEQSQLLEKSARI